MSAELPEDKPTVRELSKRQRRVLGVLLEKAFTTPESYPLTLKALTAGCNQKSNRDPVVNYSEDDVQRTLEELRELGLVAEIHTEGGRTPRYRHYMRQRYSFSEPQLAILTELLLRGRQQPGELRSRASRMVEIASLDQLREELAGLTREGYAQANGPLERRGVEVDHGFYPASEGGQLAAVRDDAPSPPLGKGGNGGIERPPREEDLALQPPKLASPPDSGRMAALETAVDELREENRDVRSTLEGVQTELRRLNDAIDELKRDLGA
ncbi:MAG: YceH family protein [Planctomycetes bacterium]|nr:YceH family protein [Planctomycetota bacterium]